MLSLRLLAPDDPTFFTQLVDKIAHSPDFFRAAPIVLDVGPVAAGEPIALGPFLEQLRQHRLFPVGIQNGSEAWNDAANAAGLAVFSAGAPASAEPPPRRPVEAMAGAATPTAPAAAAPAARRGPALSISEPVRGGQQVVAPDGDLVVTAAVGNGAEIAAVGHIHVYGTLRGRAFAGIEGDETAMIFCDLLEAQLLSIAGVHIVNDEIDPKHLGRRVRVRLAGERLVIQPAG
jgi:septum site-determining protein MinC